MALAAEDWEGSVLPTQPVLPVKAALSLDEQLDEEFEAERADLARWAKTSPSGMDENVVYRSLLGNFTFRLPHHGYWYTAEFASTPERQYLDREYVVMKDRPEGGGAIDFGVELLTTRRKFFTEVADAVKVAGVPAELVDVQSWQEAEKARKPLDEHLPQMYQAYRALRKEGYSRKSLVL